MASCLDKKFIFDGITMTATDRKHSGAQVALPRPVERALRKLGQDISAARRMRRLSQGELAQRIGASLSTVRRMEDGSPGTALHTFLRTLQVLGRLDAMVKVLALQNDDLGMELVREQLRQRVRSSGSQSGGKRSSDKTNAKDKSRPDELEGF
ncbi:MAG: helix-turn-helix domain-containing protein [Pseudomonadales bacterium]|nr:helix-turn-helix domain-containing protein [Pseudomonadales bacterium]